MAGALLLGVMFFTSGFAAALEAVMGTKAGFYLDPAALVATVYGKFFGVEVNSSIDDAGAIVALAAMCAFCIYLLCRKVRAFEVVKMTQENRQIVFDNVSKFYGDVLGVNRVTLSDSARDHQPGGTQRLRQNHADEPDDRPVAAHPRPHQRARHLAR